VPLLSQNMWARTIAWMRVALAAAVLGLGYVNPPPPPAFYEIVLGIYLVYAVFAALRSKPHTGMIGLLALFGDAVYFLFVASRGPATVWLASAFFLYLLTEAVAFYSAVEVVVVTAVAAIFCAALSFNDMSALEPTVLVAGALACGCAMNKREQTAEIERLTEALAETQRVAGKAAEDERQRIASDFHDGPLQSFISLQMRLEILRKLLTRDLAAGMEDLRQLQALAQGQIRDLRAFLHSMRPVDVDGGSMVATARRAAETFQKETGIPVTFIGTNIPVGLPPEATLEVLQIIREALNNVQKHAGATRVAVAMEKSERGLEISIDDNGHGFNFAGSYSLEELDLLHLGPVSLKRRARSLNADLLLESRPGRGAGIKVRIPLQ
jgi:signal transduction histidine kinase